MKTTIQGVEIPQQVIDELMNLFKGNEDMVEDWLIRPKVSLDGVSPLLLLGSVEGINEVLGMLERMKTGDFS
ncbi:MbcA/ParS/Xre antitoxin family protein [Colwellia psychrerythraea]|uniref:Antitoxin Xre/MbcA/ParS-like toxin-binding domain-containing protein n=1 Tax=Colwellia psychrerythraea TaxID=28229 RepID=A0A099KAK0_COLPS|nr:MbcA/ParS/Xre antitoxin family protein [Colwellia psychrerythraea]KGJ87330.1 protein of unknown function DUF2384 [Colwellia psychrerythraea]